MTLTKGTPSIIRGSDYMFSTTYEGNGEGRKVGKFVPFTDSGTIAKSAIFDNGGPAYLDKTYGSSGTSLKKFTFSCWFKLGNDTIAGTSGYFPTLFNVGGESGKYFALFYQSQYRNFQYYSYNSTYDLRGITVRTFEDTSKWYHIVIAIDTTDSTAGDRVKLYVDGDRITSFTNQVNPAQDYDLSVGAAEPYYVGFFNSGDTWDGYMAEVNYVDGTAYAPSDFGVTDTSTGRWVPKSLSGISYGTNGFRMEFANSAGQTIGDDTSGNGNDFTVNNMVAADITTDSPTQNFNNMGGSDTGSFTKAEGNLKITVPGSGIYEQCVGLSSFGVSSGKWYWEVTVNVKGATGYGWKSDDNVGGSVAKNTGGSLGTVYSVGGSGGFTDGEWTDDYSAALSNFSPFTTASADDVIMFALDLDNQKGYVGLNNTWFNSADPAAGTGSIGLGYLTTHSPNAKFYPMCLRLNTTGTGTYNFGQKDFAYTPPTGFKAWQQDNLPESTKQGISDFVWIKNRDALDSHQLYDSSRGVQKEIHSDSNAIESTTTDGLQKFLKGGCQIEDDVSINTSGESYVAWNWVCNGGTTSANTDGSGATSASTIQVNQTAGFSIVQGKYFEGSLAHGLSQAPDVIFYKEISPNVNNWYVWHKNLTSENYYLLLDSSNAQANFGSNLWSITSTTFGKNLSISPGDRDAIAYCWHSVQGFSKFGKYTGNNSSTDNVFVNLGFKPSWLLIKNLSSGAWTIFDNQRVKFNVNNAVLFGSLTNVERVGTEKCDFLSNGFKLRNNDANIGASATYVYMAFAEHPFVGSGTNPVTAK